MYLCPCVVLLCKATGLHGNPDRHLFFQSLANSLLLALEVIMDLLISKKTGSLLRLPAWAKAVSWTAAKLNQNFAR